MEKKTRLRRLATTYLLLGCFAACRVLAETSTDTALRATNAPLKEISPGVLQLGKVRLHRQERRIVFPAVVNQRQGAIEYLIVTSYGKTHESLLRTDAEPFHIQLALLLLGAKGSDTNSFPDQENLPLPGAPVTIELNWTADGADHTARAEEFVYNLESKSVMTLGEWIFNGSRVVKGTFVAQQDGSIVSVMVDPDALINNPRPGRENDKIWQVHADKLPALNSTVEVTIRLVGR